MNVSLSTDYGSPEHWERVLEFARRSDVDRVVYWWDGNVTPRIGPFLFPNYPGLVPDRLRPGLELHQRHLRTVAGMAAEAGVEFWHLFQVLDLPDVEHARRVLPGLFNSHGEPDLSSDLFTQLLRDQVDELIGLVPNLAGVEMWVMECATVQVTRLNHQSLSSDEISARIVDTVYDQMSKAGLRLDQSLHTMGGDPATLSGLLKAVSKHPDVVVSADNVIGDLHLHLPFNEHLVRAAETNPIGVNFDLNGEYWGRNFVPTSAVDQYAEHLEIARELGATYVNGRVSTLHDVWSPHANILPSRRRHYPLLSQISADRPLSPQLEVACTDTLGTFNAEFFARRAKDPSVTAEQVVRSFLKSEFGDEAAKLVPAFLQLQTTLGKIFYTDKNYYGTQSVLPRRTHVEMCAVNVQMTLPEGTAFPTPEARAASDASDYPFAFEGWPTPRDHRCAGTEAMLREKEEALAETEKMLATVEEHASALTPVVAQFLLSQFEDLALLARAFRWLHEAHVHHYLSEANQRRGDLPNHDRFHTVLAEGARVVEEWQQRYPGGRYGLAETLGAWLTLFRGDAAGAALIDGLPSVHLRNPDARERSTP